MYIKTFIVSIFVVLLIYSCEKYDDNLIVSDAELNSSIKLIEIDTLTVRFTTFKVDSLITSNSSRILVGKYEDEFFGKVTSSSYFELTPSTYSIIQTGVFDSVCMILRHDDYYINDTLRPLTINVKRLSQKIKPIQNFNYFYNYSSLNSFDAPLGSITFYPRPLSDKDSLLIKLNNEFGSNLFQKIKSKNINNQDELLDYFKGVKLEVDSSNDASILGFSNSTSYMRFYYSTTEFGEIVTHYYDMKINTVETPAKFFNQITSDRSNTYLSTLSQQSVGIIDAEINNKAFIQSGVGIYTRIDFPYLKDILNIEGNEAILSAYLYVVPFQGSYDSKLPLPEKLEIFNIDKKNNILSESYDNSGNKLYSNLQEYNNEFNEKYYSLDLSLYIENKLKNTYEDGSGFVFKTVSNNNSLDRLVFDTKKNSEYKTHIKILLVTYD